MAVAGYNSAIYCSTGFAASSTTFTEIQGIKSFKIGDSRDLLDITSFEDGNVHGRLAALRDITVDLSGDYEAADTGFLKLKAAYDAGTDIAIKIYTSAVATTAGFGYVFQVASMDINASVEGKAEVSMSLMVNASSGTHSFAL